MDNRADVGGSRLFVGGLVAVVAAVALPWSGGPGTGTASSGLTGQAAAASALAVLLALGTLLREVLLARGLAGPGPDWVRVALAGTVLILVLVRLVWVRQEAGLGALVALCGAGCAAYGSHLLLLGRHAPAEPSDGAADEDGRAPEASA